MRAVAAAAAGVAAVAVAFTLQGCGSTPAETTTVTITTTSTITTTTETTTTVTTPPGWRGFQLNPIEVSGSYLRDSVTKKRFNSKGICMPNVGQDVNEWIKVIRQIKKLDVNNKTNTLRLYSVPECAYKTDCFEPFVIQADILGFYLLLPGTGTTWGWLPGHADFCGKPATPQGCYEAGGVLGFGQTMIQHFNYPNVLALVMGNEFDMQMRPYLSVLKAYARDLKIYMKMCNEDEESPTHGQMRQIPLMYASSDDEGDNGVMPKADYLFCDGADVSIDIFGLNIERYCDEQAGPEVYRSVNAWVKTKNFPGAFYFSEDGCTRTVVPNHYRSWSQITNFFEKTPAISGFTAYAWYGNQDFDMFDGPYANATMNQDGKNFFDRVKTVGNEPEAMPADTSKVPDCPSSILGVKVADYNDVKIYPTGEAGWAKHCPRPPPGPETYRMQRELVF